MALALALQEKYDVAEPLLEQVLQLEPNFVEGHLCLGNCQEALGKSAAAIETLEQIAKLRPDLEEFCKREADRLRDALGGAT